MVRKALLAVALVVAIVVSILVATPVAPGNNTRNCIMYNNSTIRCAEVTHTPMP